MIYRAYPSRNSHLTRSHDVPLARSQETQGDYRQGVGCKADIAFQARGSPSVSWLAALSLRSIVGESRHNKPSGSEEPWRGFGVRGRRKRGFHAMNVPENVPAT